MKRFGYWKGWGDTSFEEFAAVLSFRWRDEDFDFLTWFVYFIWSYLLDTAISIYSISNSDYGVKLKIWKRRSE